MTGTELLKLADDLEAYLAGFDEHFGRAENREHVRRFARGQLGPLERKSLEPMADAEGVAPRGLQQFFSRYAWDEEGARDALQRHVARQYGGAEGVFICDETSDAKKGEWTAGVARQYCGESGKVDNCIVTVHLAYACGGFQALLDGALFLPESWDPNPADPGVTEQRRRASIPAAVVHESKALLALRQLKRARANGVPGRWVSADEGYGGKPWWRRAVAQEGLGYVVEVPRSTAGWTREPQYRTAPYRGLGRPPQPKAARPARRVEELARASRATNAWTRFRVHDTHKGPEVWEVQRKQFWEQAEDAPDGAQTLLVARNVRTGERKYFLSNAPEETPLAELLRVAFSRWRIERCFQDCKTELGLNHAELRTYRGLHRHLLLTALNYFFLVDRVGAHGGEKNARSDHQPVCRRAAGAA